MSLAALIGLGAALSGFMNNVGAMALLMPVAVQLAGRLEIPPGRVLMPLAFGTILGGMTTMIGTPPNLIVSGFRAQSNGDGFGVFDFSPVGIPVALVGVAFIALVGWRLVPTRKKAGAEGFKTEAYLTEVRIPEDSKTVGMTLRDIETVLDEAEAQVVGLVRNEVRMTAPQAGRKVLAGDILIIEAEAEALASVLSNMGLTLEEAVPSDDKDTSEDKAAALEKTGDRDNIEEEAATPDEVVLMELVVRPGSAMTGSSAKDMLLRTRYGLNLLAVSREGTRSRGRLRTLKIQPGDLLLMQGPPEILTEFATDNGCVLMDRVTQGHVIVALTLILVVTMFLSDLINNTATAAVMCPIALGTANALGVNADSFLMAVAIGAYCAFLTPIGHQNNTLILGPGGFRFGDYWRLGLPLEILVVVISVPLLLLAWPL